ncbi:MAG: hypothetical protein WCK29_01655 [archaeon]
MLPNNKKGQEEIVGFVAIVLLVTIIGVIFLGLMIKNDTPVAKESKDVTRLLDSAMQYTSNCAIDYLPNYASLQDLIQKCYEQNSNVCQSKEKVCSALNRTLLGILDGNIKTGVENKNKGYVFKTEFSYNISAGNGTEILKVMKGNCSTDSFIQGYSSFQGQKGEYISTLKLCY